MILEFFTNMHADLGGIIINGKGMVQLIGEKLSNGLVEKLVHECLTPAVPYETEDLPAFEQLIAASEEFSTEMKVFFFFCNLCVTLVFYLVYPPNSPLGISLR
ncbi:unnamed protein product [Gongylonema pulchrum]|uniref:ARM repeat superfamily protein n=1 Tax=Gongylonema pulchrum TaxID=637853 RepID=A0A183EVP5_9BILA|nr:unnamed protein product [Gongylonema pulchrum]